MVLNGSSGNKSPLLLSQPDHLFFFFIFLILSLVQLLWSSLSNEYDDVSVFRDESLTLSDCLTLLVMITSCCLCSSRPLLSAAVFASSGSLQTFPFLAAAAALSSLPWHSSHFVFFSTLGILFGDEEEVEEDEEEVEVVESTRTQPVSRQCALVLSLSQSVCMCV